MAAARLRRGTIFSRQHSSTALYTFFSPSYLQVGGVGWLEWPMVYTTLSLQYLPHAVGPIGTNARDGHVADLRGVVVSPAHVNLLAHLEHGVGW